MGVLVVLASPSPISLLVGIQMKQTRAFPSVLVIMQPPGSLAIDPRRIFALMQEANTQHQTEKREARRAARTRSSGSPLRLTWI